jgi:hypothetical protein
MEVFDLNTFKVDTLFKSIMFAVSATIRDAFKRDVFATDKFNEVNFKVGTSNTEKVAVPANKFVKYPLEALNLGVLMRDAFMIDVLISEAFMTEVLMRDAFMIDVFNS